MYISTYICRDIDGYVLDYWSVNRKNSKAPNFLILYLDLRGDYTSVNLGKNPSICT